ncbi:MAG: hypothetical protein K6B75_06105, partial [Lachnospiraceae bacterium]|nr:hypothetical protein [Lachnospiraceae bacterium]
MDINGFAAAVGSFEKAKVDKLTEPEKKTEKTLTEAVLPSTAEETAAAEYTPSNISEMVEYDKITVEKMKAEADQRTEQLRQLVEKMLLKQGQKFTTLSEAIEDIRDGIVEVDPEVAAQAAEDIAEDG